MRLYVARHAECAKNLIGIPGGKGNSLTSRGKDQAGELSTHVASLREPMLAIDSCPPVQALETANIIAHRLRLTVQVREELSSIGLGVLTGVPIDKAKRLHPASSASMDLWRSGQIELCDVKIDGMEDPLQFYLRGLRYLLRLARETDTRLVIATTSILILFDNLHRMHGAARGENYRAREYANAKLATLDFSSEQMDWLHRQAEIYDAL